MTATAKHANHANKNLTTFPSGNLTRQPSVNTDLISLSLISCVSRLILPSAIRNVAKVIAPAKKVIPTRAKPDSEMIAMTQIRLLVITVKEKRGAILKIAPQDIKKVSNKA